MSDFAIVEGVTAASGKKVFLLVENNHHSFPTHGFYESAAAAQQQADHLIKARQRHLQMYGQNGSYALKARVL